MTMFTLFISIDEFLSYKDLILNILWPTFLAIMAIVLVICFSAITSKNIKNNSIQNIKQNINNRKYISDVYIEVGESEEALRIFVDRKLMKNLLRRFKLLFKDKIGKCAFKLLKINFFNNTKRNLIKNIDKIIDFCDNHKRNSDLESYIYHNLYLKRFDALKIKYLAEFSTKRAVIVKGNAGTGKTNLICDLTTQLKNKNFKVVYFNCRDMRNDIEKEYNSQFLKNGLFDKYRKISSVITEFLYCLSHKIIIIFEGVNENTNTDYGRYLLNFINSKIKKNVKIIVTTRQEHYSRSFKNQIEEIITNNKYLSTLDLDNINETNPDFDNIILKYKNHYNFKGTISNETKRLISHNLFMVRMFFEAFKNCNDEANITNFNAIFNQYLLELNKECPNANFVLNKIVELMCIKREYVEIKENDLINSGVNKSDIDKLVLCSAFINKRHDYNKNIMYSLDDSYIGFVFDEFRDFLIFRNLKMSKRNLALEINKMIVAGDQAIEGVAKYAYLDARINNDMNSIQSILSIPNLSNIYVLSKNKYRGEFTIIFQLILDCELQLLQEEIIFFENNNCINELEYLSILAIKKVSKNDTSLYKRLINFIESMYFDSKYYNLIKEAISSINKSDTKDTLVLNSLNKLIRKIHKPKDYNDEEPFIPKYLIKYSLVPSFESKTLNFKKFVSYFNFEKNTKVYLMSRQLYDMFYYSTWSVYNEFKRYYSSYYPSYETFLINRYEIRISKIQFFNKKDLNLKYRCTSEDNSIANFSRLKIVSEYLRKLEEMQYDD